VKIALPRDALARRADDNARVDVASEAQRLLDVARRLFAGRDGRIALTLVLVLTATLEAAIYTPNVQEGAFPFETHSNLVRRSSSTFSPSCRSSRRSGSRFSLRRARHS
jgi:hypothetical protein